MSKENWHRRSCTVVPSAGFPRSPLALSTFKNFAPKLLNWFTKYVPNNTTLKQPTQDTKSGYGFVQHLCGSDFSYYVRAPSPGFAHLLKCCDIVHCHLLPSLESKICKAPSTVFGSPKTALVWVNQNQERFGSPKAFPKQ